MSGGLRCCLNPGLVALQRRRRRRGTPGRSSRMVALVGCATSRAAGARRGRWGYSSTRVVARLLDVDEETPGRSSRVVARPSAVAAACRVGLLKTVYNIHIFPGQAHRWLVDEGVGGRCRGLRASCMLYNLATYRIGAVTGMGITQRGGGRSRA